MRPYNPVRSSAHVRNFRKTSSFDSRCLRSTSARLFAQHASQMLRAQRANPRLETRHPLWQDGQKLHASRRKPYTLTRGLYTRHLAGDLPVHIGLVNGTCLRTGGIPQVRIRGSSLANPSSRYRLGKLLQKINRNSASPECMRLARGHLNSMSLKLRNTCVSLASDVLTICAFNLIAPPLFGIELAGLTCIAATCTAAVRWANPRGQNMSLQR